MKAEKAYLTNMVLAAGFLIIGFFFERKGSDWAYIFPTISLVVLVLSSLHLSLAKFIAKWWLEFGKALGTINSTILLSIMFYLFLVPLALLRKAFNRKPSTIKSTWKDRRHDFSAADFEKPW